MAISSKFRAALRAQAHHLSATVHAGRQGVIPALVRSLDDALRTRSLVKVQFGPEVGLSAKRSAPELAGRVGAEVVQVIGHRATFFREIPE